MAKKEDEPPNEDIVPLEKLLRIADLLRYDEKLRNDLKLRHAGDIQYVDECDLNAIGMSRPEQKRLRKEYSKIFPPTGLVGKLKKVFARNENSEKRDAIKDTEGEQHVIPLEKITLCKELGKGEFGAVFQASWNNGPAISDTMQVAVKCVNSDRLVQCPTSFLSEAAIMTRMRHENVVRLYGVVLDTKKIMMVSELAMCGSLLECLHKPALRDSFPVDVLCDYAGQIAQGMAYLEVQRLIHRDLAARNVLVFGPKKVKISDFGLSRSLGVGEDYYRSEFTPNLRLPIAWCAPESINFLKFTSSSDVWSYGVTLWEMFTYGEMPWNGYNGAQILEAVDQELRHLPRPSACPDDMWDLCKECWIHDHEKRPTFKAIVESFTDRLPQTVRTIRDCAEAAVDHLQFKKDELITVLCRAPSSYPDGFYWLGSLKSGKTGLFRPMDTVAHLGAECPSGFKVLTTGCVGGATANGKEKEKKKDAKESDRDRKKLMISEPQGDFRHTCHVGIDGTAFGLLQLDKKEITRAPVSPQSRRSTTSTGTGSVDAKSVDNRSISSPVTSSLISSPVPLKKRENGGETVTFRNTIQIVSPPGSRAPSQPSSKFGNIKDPISENSFNELRASLEPSAPPLSAPSSLTRQEASSLTDRLDESLNALSGSIHGSVKNDEKISFVDDDFLQIRRSQNLSTPISAVYARMPHNNSLYQPSTSDTFLMDEVVHLERDLTDFSLSTLGDYSDTRPLLHGENRRAQAEEVRRRSGEGETIHSNSSSPPTIRMMSEDELTRWRDKQIKEHKKVDKQLYCERKRETQTRNGTEEKPFSSHTPSENGEWSTEAQQAYRLLVECGDRLKMEHSPEPVHSQTMYNGAIGSSSFSQSNGCSHSVSQRTTNKQTTSPSNKVDVTFSTHDIRPALPPKSYVNQDAIRPPLLPPKPNAKTAVPEPPKSVYDNLNGISQINNKAPPPVPPKPKVSKSIESPTKDEYAKGFAPAIARSSLFAASKREEVVKF